MGELAVSFSDKKPNDVHGSYVDPGVQVYDDTKTFPQGLTTWVI
jgi:hypothetical protein